MSRHLEFLCEQKTPRALPLQNLCSCESNETIDTMNRVSRVLDGAMLCMENKCRGLGVVGLRVADLSRVPCRLHGEGDFRPRPEMGKAARRAVWAESVLDCTKL